MQHHFVVEEATKYGVNAAILLNNIRFWCAKNLANEKHIHEGRAWTYNSVRAFNVLFPYMTVDVIRRGLDLLVDEGVLLVGNYNTVKYDQTRWFTLNTQPIEVKSQAHLAKTTNEIGRKHKPIPDINTDKNTPDHANKVCNDGVGLDEGYDVVAVGDDGEELQPRKKPVGKYPGADAVCALFAVRSKFWAVNTGIRAAASRLYAEKGLAKVQRALDFYEDNKDEQYCPRITNPIDLEEKWDKLFAFKQKNNL